jgi:hypothetical protein
LQQGSIKLNNHPEGGLIATIKVPRVQHPLN